VASHVLNHTNIRIYPNPIPIDGYLGRAYATRAAAGRKVLGNIYASRAVVDRSDKGNIPANRASAESARVPHTPIAPSKADAEKKEHRSERARYIRLMIIIEAATALCLYGIWQLWHMIH